MADLTGNSLQVYRLETLAATHLALGQLRQAECSLEQALSLRQARGEAKTTRMNYQTATRIALLLRTGRIDAAKAQLGSFVTESTVPGGVNRSALERQMLQAETAMAAGERAQAQALATDLLQQIQRSAQATYLRDLSARSLQLQGQAWLTMGQFALSHQALQQVVDLYTALYDPGRSMALADSLVMQANVARRSGRSDEAAHLARQARAIVKNRNVHPVLGAQDGCTH
jgi:tetratricopeptide (TPR) repeat protein